MTHTAASLTGHRRAIPGVGEILRRVAGPFAIFAFVLLSLLLLSWVLLLPRYTRVELHGMLLRPAEVLSMVDEVREGLAKMEEKRQSLILPLDASPYGSLVREKVEGPSLLTFQETIRNIARTVVPEQEYAVWIEVVRMKSDGTAEIRGDIRNVGLQSMAVLAQFARMVGNLPSVTQADLPTFTREHDPQIGFHSPFSFSVTLR
jgi:hypothetical protein